MVSGSPTVCTDSAPHHQVRGFRWAEPAVSGRQRSLFRFAPALNAYAKQGRHMKSARQKSQHALVIPGSLLATSVHADPGVRLRSQALSIPIGLMQLLGRTVAGVQIRMRHLAEPVSSSSDAHQFQRKVFCTTLQSDSLLQRYP
jgi:hypothetical protein